VVFANTLEEEFLKFNGEKILLKQNMSRDVENVIDCLICNGCEKYYIGQTGDKLRMRRTVHAQQVRDPSTIKLPLSEHLDVCCETEPIFFIFQFYKCFSKQLSARLVKEQFLSRYLSPLYMLNNALLTPKYSSNEV